MTLVGQRNDVAVNHCVPLYCMNSTPTHFNPSEMRVRAEGGHAIYKVDCRYSAGDPLAHCADQPTSRGIYSMYVRMRSSKVQRPG
jgi:hypothetical protein